MEEILKYTPVTLTEEVKKVLTPIEILYLQNKGVPSIIACIGGLVYKAVTPYINNSSLIIGEYEGTNVVHYLILDITSKNIFHQWNYNNEAKLIFINSDIEKLVMSNFIWFNVVRKLIISEVLGAYYDNTEKGGHFEAYANLLEDLILDVDKIACEKGAWFSLINEKKMGVL